MDEATELTRRCPAPVQCGTELTWFDEGGYCSKHGYLAKAREPKPQHRAISAGDDEGSKFAGGIVVVCPRLHIDLVENIWYLKWASDVPSRELWQYNPLEKHPTLLMEFAALDTGEHETIVEFCEKWGLLGLYYHQPGAVPGVSGGTAWGVDEEPLFEFAAFHDRFRAWLNAARLLVEGAVHKIQPWLEGVTTDSGDPVEYAGNWLERELNAWFFGKVIFRDVFYRGGIRPVLLSGPSKGKSADLQLSPTSLADALVIGLFNYWKDDKKLRQCDAPKPYSEEVCGRWHTRRRFCSDLCNDRFWQRERRKPKKEGRAHEPQAR